MKMTSKLKPIVVCLTLAVVQSVVFAQERARISAEVLTNEKVLSMVHAGLAPTIIVNKIYDSKTSFNTQTEELIRLQQARVPAEVIDAMVRSSSRRKPVMSGDDARVNETADAGLPKEIGVYVKTANEWKEVLPEVVNWKTGGILKSGDRRLRIHRKCAGREGVTHRGVHAGVPLWLQTLADHPKLRRVRPAVR